MNIRKFFRLSCLTIASLFWASCDGDSNSQGPDNTPDPESSSDILGTSSSAEPESSSDEMLPGSSSSEVPEVSSSDAINQSSSETASSSSDQAESSSSAKKYILASDSSVTCTRERSSYKDCVYSSSPSPSYSCMELQDFLKKDTSVTEKVLLAWEEKLESCGAVSMPVAVYGVFYDPCASAPTYTKIEMKCSNGVIYPDYRIDGDLVYKNKEEYNAAHGISSSSAESSSSVQEDLVQNCPHDEFSLFADVLADVQGALYEKIVNNLEENAELNEVQKTYLEGILDRENKKLKGNFAPYLEGDLRVEEVVLGEYGTHGVSSVNWFNGFIAKTKTCADGTPEITESYKALYEAIYEEALGLLNSQVNKAK